MKTTDHLYITESNHLSSKRKEDVINRIIHNIKKRCNILNKRFNDICLAVIFSFIVFIQTSMIPKLKIPIHIRMLHEIFLIQPDSHLYILLSLKQKKFLKFIFICVTKNKICIYLYNIISRKVYKKSLRSQKYNL